MYAIVDISGKQFKVEKDQKIYAPLMEGKEGDINLLKDQAKHLLQTVGGIAFTDRTLLRY